jgi:hypothetical protein
VFWNWGSMPHRQLECRPIAKWRGSFAGGAFIMAPKGDQAIGGAGLGRRFSSSN